MPAYVRPAIDAPPAIADDGVPYGSRRDATGTPAEDACTRVSRLERFAPLHAVAVRSVRLAPRDGNGRTLTLEYTGFPGVLLHSGRRMAEAFPQCGCDACDDRWEDVADSLEEAVLLAAGQPPPREPFGDLVR
ncbi:DUF6226 family protein [Clavibacter michiganensis]|uniref:DUF6226 family protein n=1 Tax=Clavibacter michiganensis TaxID=28447 RepID=UPI00292EBF09|nr:DUF6226 family protein [Clavibacter michiganensis]